MPVDAYLQALEHPRKAEIEQLRRAILESDELIGESVKWNAPNFVFDGEDRVTFRLQPKDHVQLILHRGAKVRDDVQDFRFADPDGLVDWATPDRGVVTVADADDLQARAGAIVELVRRWVRA